PAGGLSDETYTGDHSRRPAADTVRVRARNRRRGNRSKGMSPRTSLRNRKVCVEELEPRQLLDAGVSGLTRPLTDRFVVHLYDDALQREAEPGGFAFWKGQVDNGASRAVATLGVTQSLEYETKFVSSLFHWYLGRAPGPAGNAA